MTRQPITIDDLIEIKKKFDEMDIPKIENKPIELTQKEFDLLKSQVEKDTNVKVGWPAYFFGYQVKIVDDYKFKMNVQV